MPEKKPGRAKAGRRSSPKRLVRLQGRLSMKASRRARESIAALRRKSSAPITLEIQSSGGRVRAFYEIARALRPRRAKKKSCRFITLGNGVGSAAAYLLVVGDYACVRAGTEVKFHGVKLGHFNKMRILKREQILAMGLQMDRENRIIAKKMARHVVGRMLARYVDFTRRKEAGHGRADLEGFTRMINDRLSSRQSRKVLAESLRRSGALLSAIERHSGGRTRSTGISALESGIFKELIDDRRNARTIKSSLATEIMMDYLLAREFLRGRRQHLIDELIERYGKSLMTPQEKAACRRAQARSPARARNYAISALRPKIHGWWCLAFGLCHQLLSGEFSLPAEDAYWLGLVDEVLPSN